MVIGVYRRTRQAGIKKNSSAVSLGLMFLKVGIDETKVAKTALLFFNYWHRVALELALGLMVQKSMNAKVAKNRKGTRRKIKLDDVQFES